MKHEHDPFEHIQFCELCKTRRASVIPLRSAGAKPVRKLVCTKCAGFLKKQKYIRFVVNKTNRHLSFYLLLVPQRKASPNGQPHTISLTSDQVVLLRARGFRVDKMEGSAPAETLPTLAEVLG